MAGLQVQEYIAYAHFVFLVVAAAAFCCFVVAVGGDGVAAVVYLF